ncbi:MAG TPA: electron transfer flavoprotein subunit alpha/FixB family protein [Bacteroidia bacterium]|nr:electron transfer flavoprotein subunit alpha/FixB family protein [Bacteroidia bacterium]
MSVLVYCENASGKFKKSTYEALSYGAAVAGMTGGQLAAISIGDVSNDELNNLARYGASKVYNANASNLKNFTGSSYSAVISAAAAEMNASVVVMSNSFSGKGLAPRVAVKLKAGLVDGAIALPDTSAGFTVRKNAFSGKAFADVNVLSAVKVISVVPNSYKVTEAPVTAEIIVFNPSLPAWTAKEEVKEIVKASDIISLPEAELVVSAGRGLKGPENWGMIETLAGLLGAATACSKPVSDAHWRPHSEHVGQTGISISPNLYIAIGISGAIQHLAGVSSSKTIVVINKDPEAPFFKSADYGIVGDAFEVVPKLIEAVKKFKSAN